MYGSACFGEIRLEQTKEFTGLQCGLYLIAVGALLPLYTGGSYWQLGDTKYLFFRNITALWLGLWLAVILFSKLRERMGKAVRTVLPMDAEAATDGECGGVETAGTADEAAAHEGRMGGKAWNTLDTYVLLYGFCVLLSAFLSSYRATAWSGFHEWYMGAVSQLFFVGIYFFVSRCFDGKRYPLLSWSAAFGIVIFIGLANRLGFDPTGLFSGFNSGDWEYSHMLSTIGNINWFCGYCGVASAVPLTGYLTAEKKWSVFVYYVLSVAGLLLLLIQGSDIGLVMAAVCIAFCLMAGLVSTVAPERALYLAGGVCLLLPLYGLVAALLGDEALKALPADGIGRDKISWGGWWIAGAVCLAAGAVWRWRRARKRCAGNGDCAPQEAETLLGDGKHETGEIPEQSGKLSPERAETMPGQQPRKRKSAGRSCLLPCIAVVLLGTVFLVFLYCVLRQESQRPDGLWGSGRGTLWKLAIQGFWQNDLIHKLVGVGPDCFAEYIYSAFSPEQLTLQEGRWADAIYANAHNEWLNHLVNLGIMGTGCYLGIFCTCLLESVRRLKMQDKKLRRTGLLGALAILLYATASLTCFQQCISTPMLFAVLGVCRSGEAGRPEMRGCSRVAENEGRKRKRNIRRGGFGGAV